MVKFFSLIAAAVCAVAGVQAQNASLPACTPQNFTEKAADVKSLNGVIDIAINTGLLATKLADLDPITISEQRLDAVPFSLLGLDFTFTPIIQALNVGGLSTLVPGKFNVTGPTGLQWGVQFNGTVAAIATIRLEIAQLNKQWWQICWTSATNPITCPPANIDIDVGAIINKPNLGLDLLLEMFRCPPANTIPKGSCRDLTVSDILIAALNDKLEPLLARILLRIKTAQISTLAVDFEQLASLNIHFQSSGPLVTEIGKKLLGFTAKEINKKGLIYDTVTGIINDLGKSLVNDLLTNELGPQFGAGCYDPKA